MWLKILAVNKKVGTAFVQQYSHGENKYYRIELPYSKERLSSIDNFPSIQDEIVHGFEIKSQEFKNWEELFSFLESLYHEENKEFFDEPASNKEIIDYMKTLPNSAILECLDYIERRFLYTDPDKAEMSLKIIKDIASIKTDDEVKSEYKRLDEQCRKNMEIKMQELMPPADEKYSDFESEEIEYKDEKKENNIMGNKK